ncbi:hypothetical protein ACFL2J_06925 [Candidatus Omnitrophota bacterium]
MPKVPAVIKQVENFMLKKHFTQTDMANHLEISVTQLNRWLRTHNMSKVWIKLLSVEGIIKDLPTKRNH